MDLAYVDPEHVRGVCGRYQLFPVDRLEEGEQKDGLGKVQVNSLDTPDCHHLPKDFTGWAKENGVQLWAGGGGEGSGMSLLPRTTFI